MSLPEPSDSLATAKQRQRLVAFLQFTSFGAPMVYYGDESGINAPGRSGFGDPYNRAPYPWEDESGNVNAYGPAEQFMADWYSSLATLRQIWPALRTGSVVTLLTGDTTSSSTDNGVYAFGRVGAPNRPVHRGPEQGRRGRERADSRAGPLSERHDARGRF